MYFLQNSLISVFFAIALIVGGVASIINAANLQDDMDHTDCIGHGNHEPKVDKYILQTCHANAKQLRESQVASAVSFIYVFMCTI